jgi:hypothetical protein
MKLTRDKLKQIIKEELEEMMVDEVGGMPPPPPPPSVAAPKAQFDFNKLGTSYNTDYLVDGKPRTEQEIFNLAANKGPTTPVTLKSTGQQTIAGAIIKQMAAKYPGIERAMIMHRDALQKQRKNIQASPLQKTAPPPPPPPPPRK